MPKGFARYSRRGLTNGYYLKLIFTVQMSWSISRQAFAKVDCRSCPYLSFRDQLLYAEL